MEEQPPAEVPAAELRGVTDSAERGHCERWRLVLAVVVSATDRVGVPGSVRRWEEALVEWVGGESFDAVGGDEDLVFEFDAFAAAVAAPDAPPLRAVACARRSRSSKR